MPAISEFDVAVWEAVASFVTEGRTIEVDFAEHDAISQLPKGAVPVLSPAPVRPRLVYESDPPCMLRELIIAEFDNVSGSEVEAALQTLCARGLLRKTMVPVLPFADPYRTGSGRNIVLATYPAEKGPRHPHPALRDYDLGTMMGKFGDRLRCVLRDGSPIAMRTPEGTEEAYEVPVEAWNVLDQLRRRIDSEADGRTAMVESAADPASGSGGEGKDTPESFAGQGDVPAAVEANEGRPMCTDVIDTEAVPLDQTPGSKGIVREWPDPREHTTAKCWTLKGGTFCMSTKTDAKSDGTVRFAPVDGKPTLQSKLMRLLCYWHPAATSLQDIVRGLYWDEVKTAGEDRDAMVRILKNVRAVVSDIRDKKLKPAGINPDILPRLSVESQIDTGITLRFAKLHRMDDKTLDEADKPHGT